MKGPGQGSLVVSALDGGDTKPEPLEAMEFSGIVSRSVRIFLRHRRFLLGVLLVTQLPLLLLGLLGAGVLAIQASQMRESGLSEAILEFGSMHPVEEGEFMKGPPPTKEMVQFAATAASFVAVLAVVAVASVLSTLALVSYVVSCDYLGRTPSFRNSGLAVVRRTLLRLAGTGVAKLLAISIWGLTYVLVILLPTTGLAALFIPGGRAEQSPGTALYVVGLLIVLELVGLFVGLLYVEILLSLGMQVTAVEGLWGFAALKRSMALVEASKKDVLLLTVVLTALYTVLQQPMGAALSLSMTCGPAALLWFVLLLAYLAANLLGHIARVVLYMSCRCKQEEGFNHAHLADFVDGDASPGYAAVPLAEPEAKV